MEWWQKPERTGDISDDVIERLLMPGSEMPVDGMEMDLVKEALKMNAEGIPAKVTFAGEGQSGYGRVIEEGKIIYEDPRLPGKHVELSMQSGHLSTKVVPGSLNHRVALEKHLMATGHWDEYADGGQGAYSKGTPTWDSPGSDAHRAYEKLSKTQPLEAKYLDQAKRLIQQGYKF